MTPELQHTLVAVALGLGLIVCFLSVVGFIVLGAWGVAWLRARWDAWRDRAAGETE